MIATAPKPPFRRRIPAPVARRRERGESRTLLNVSWSGYRKIDEALAAHEIPYDALREFRRRLRL